MKKFFPYVIFCALTIILVVATILVSVLFVHKFDTTKYDIPYGKQLLDAKWVSTSVIEDEQPESFKEFILHNNTPVLLDDLYKNLDDESKRILDVTLLRILHYPDKKYSKFFLQDDAIIDTFKTDKELEYKKYVKEHYQDIFKKFKFLRKFDISSRLFLTKLNFKDANQKTLNYIKNKVVIDGGAYYGDCALIMSEFEPAKIYSFDISRKTVNDYKKIMKMNNITNYEINRLALSDKKGSYKITSKRIFGGILETGISKDDTVESIDIDTFLKEKHENRKVGFIHADVQGALLMMIDGMEKTIKKDRPILSLDISNSPQEFFYAKPKLEKILKDLNYKIKIINYNDDIPSIIGISIWAYPKELDD